MPADAQWGGEGSRGTECLGAQGAVVQALKSATSFTVEMCSSGGGSTPALVKAKWARSGRHWQPPCRPGAPGSGWPGTHWQGCVRNFWSGG